MLASLRRVTFLLAPKESNGRIARNLREKVLSLSLKSKSQTNCKFFPSFHVLVFGLKEEDDTIRYYVLLSFNYSHNTNHVPKFGFSTFGTISAFHFHHFSTHATCVT